VFCTKLACGVDPELSKLTYRDVLSEISCMVIRSVATVQVASMVANVTSMMSRVAVFINLLRLEETRHEPRPFDDALRGIENHAEHGLYGILCHLHVIHRQASAMDGSDNVDLAASVDAALAEVQLIEAARPAHRHLRAISIISDFAQLLQRLTVVLDYTA